jgi:hypothetical protein
LTIAPPRSDARSGVLHREPGAAKVDLVDAVEDVLGERLHVEVGGEVRFVHSGVVVEHVEPAEPVHGRIDQRPDLFGLGHVAVLVLGLDALGPDHLDGLGALLVIDVANHHAAGALLGHLDRGRAPDPISRSRDQTDFAV